MTDNEFRAQMRQLELDMAASALREQQHNEECARHRAERQRLRAEHQRLILESVARQVKVLDMEMGIKTTSGSS